MRLSRFAAMTFDVYGTLIDWEPTIIGHLRAWADANRVAAADAELLRAYDRARGRDQAVRPAPPYSDILRASFAGVAANWGKPADTARADAFEASVTACDPFPDSRECLSYLRRFFKLGAVSNIDNRSFEATLAKLGTGFASVAAEDVGAYKPDLPHFVKMISELGRLGVAPDRVLHVAQSLHADIAPGNRLGLTTAWINRDSRRLGRTGADAEAAKPDLTFTSLAKLVVAHRAESAGTGLRT